MLIEAFGLAADLPPGWEGRIFRNEPGEPTLHAATFPLPASDGEFGGRALANMPTGGAFVAVTEYAARLANTPLFAPALTVTPAVLAAFSPRALERTRPGQLGNQRFVTLQGRPFCLYVVVAGGPWAADRVAAANTILASLRVGPSTDAEETPQPLEAPPGDRWRRL